MSDHKNKKILLVDDEADILEFVSYNLTKEGYDVSTANNGKEAIQKAKELKPHLIILDVMMPEMDGIETCAQMREIDDLNNTIIAFLTARGEDYSQIAGFDAGGDDYITKPIKPKVLISRVKALLKRYKNEKGKSSSDDENIIEIANLTIDREKYIVIKDEEEMILPRKEFELLVLLTSKTNKVFTRDEIYNAVWGDNIIVGDRTIDVHIRKLREKIGNELIKTIKGVGYKFVE
jgi:two-component system alkaline phosphatase synthesis response regulator PhoP